jgi:chorismate dehydratase
MWDFDHPPLASALAARYLVHSTQPSLCADELLEGRADLGLIPIAALTPSLAIVPGCAIASLDRVRSIQLIVKLDPRRNGNKNCHSGINDCHSDPELAEGEESPYFARSLTSSDVSEPGDTDRALAAVRTVAADTASRSSLAYAQVLFRKFIRTDPTFLPTPADPIAMLSHADAALLIGDPALLAIEARARIESTVGPCLWLDLAHEWISRTRLPWVAAVWAVRPEALAASSITAAQLTADLQLSRDHGLAHIDSLVEEWAPRIAIPPATIRRYLTHHIHYTLSPACIDAIALFRRYAAEANLLPPLPTLRFL